MKSISLIPLPIHSFAENKPSSRPFLLLTTHTQGI